MTPKHIIVVGTITSFKDLIYTMRAEISDLGVDRGRFTTLSGNVYRLVTDARNMHGFGRDCYFMCLHDSDRNADRLARERFKSLDKL